MYKKASIISLCFLLLLSGCAQHVTFVEAAQLPPVGFWYGLWHGMILPLAWIASLVSDNVDIYAIYNNGISYNFGFLLGVGASSAVSTSGMTKK